MPRTSKPSPRPENKDRSYKAVNKLNWMCEEIAAILGVKKKTPNVMITSVRCTISSLKKELREERQRRSGVWSDSIHCRCGLEHQVILDTVTGEVIRVITSGDPPDSHSEETLAHECQPKMGCGVPETHDRREWQRR